MSPPYPPPFRASPTPPPLYDYYSQEDLMALEQKPPFCQYLYVKI